MAVSTSFPSVTTASASSPRARRRVTSVFLWALQIGLAGMFLMAGSLKLAGDPQLVGAFEAIGVGQWFRYVTGGIEVVAALLLLVPRTAFYGAALLVPTMIGAVITHLFVIGGSSTIPAVLLVGSALVAWLRRRG